MKRGWIPNLSLFLLTFRERQLPAIMLCPSESIRKTYMSDKKTVLDPMLCLCDIALVRSGTGSRQTDGRAGGMAAEIGTGRTGDAEAWRRRRAARTVFALTAGQQPARRPASPAGSGFLPRDRQRSRRVPLPAGCLLLRGAGTAAMAGMRTIMTIFCI